MSLAKHFSNKLEDLWKRRTAELRALVIPRGVGQPPKFSRQVRQRYINHLLDDASKILLKRDGWSEFRKIAPHRRLWQIKGHGLLNRGSNLLKWAETKLPGPIVYTFWRGRKCLYVGKGGTWKRLHSYEKSAYLLQANCIEVFLVTNKSQLGKAECLATHLFQPRDEKVKPAKEKWGKACPICRKHDAIRDELNSLFKMK
jgi:hypothetical protein